MKQGGLVMGLIHIGTIFVNSGKEPTRFSSAIGKVILAAAVGFFGVAGTLVAPYVIDACFPKKSNAKIETSSPTETKNSSSDVNVGLLLNRPSITSEKSLPPSPKVSSIISLQTTIPPNIDPQNLPPAPPKLDPSFGNLSYSANRIPTLNDRAH